MSKLIPILDNGHSGMINGNYLTPGKRSPNWSRGILYEGMFNRWIVNAVMKELDYLRIPYFHVSPELTDISLSERVKRANDYHRQSRNKGYLVSIHANAGRGTGWEVFTSPGQTKSDEIAEHFIDRFCPAMPIKHRKDTSDGDGDKEAQFYILTKTVCPAILIECGFMDHPKDYELLWDKDFQNIIVKSIVNSIKTL